MRLVKRLVTLVWVGALLATGCALYLVNTDTVTVDLVWLEIPETSLSVVLFVTFLPTPLLPQIACLHCVPVYTYCILRCIVVHL